MKKIRLAIKWLFAIIAIFTVTKIVFSLLWGITSIFFEEYGVEYSPILLIGTAIPFLALSAYAAVETGHAILGEDKASKISFRSLGK